MYLGLLAYTVESRKVGNFSKFSIIPATSVFPLQTNLDFMSSSDTVTELIIDVACYIKM